ncbi:MAG: hypothetical protein ACKVX7_02980 [Planctomycetota bacterium]
MSDPDGWTLTLFSKKIRWLTTVGLQGFLGLVFLFAPGLTISVLDVEPSATLGMLFQLYGALLLHRAVMEQFVRWRKDPWLCRAYMISSYPFEIPSAVLLIWAILHGMMNAVIGWIWVWLFVAETLEFSFALVRHRQLSGRRAVACQATSSAGN